MFEAPRSIVEGVKPIVYIGAATTASPVDMPRQRGAILQFLEAAWRHYREACGP